MNLQSCTAMITGGAVRIGRAICVQLAKKGCNIIIHYNNSKKEADDLASSLKKLNSTSKDFRKIKTFTIHSCLSSQKDCDKLINHIWQKTGGFNILINNAGVFHKDHLLDVTETKLMKELSINFIVPMMLTRAFSLLLKADNKKGKIINLLDKRIAGNEAGCIPYLLSKKMLADFTKNAALELAPSITVNGVAPGAILPPVNDENASTRDLAGNVPLNYQCTPEDVAEAVIFLLESNAVTGNTIFVDGGQHLL